MDDMYSRYHRHYKGGLYFLIDRATHTETEEEMVVYNAFDQSKVWVRPAAMFDGTVEVDGQQVPRFRRLSREDHIPELRKSCRCKTCYPYDR